MIECCIAMQPSPQRQDAFPMMPAAAARAGQGAEPFSSPPPPAALPYNAERESPFKDASFYAPPKSFMDHPAVICSAKAAVAGVMGPLAAPRHSQAVLTPSIGATGSLSAARRCSQLLSPLASFFLASSLSVPSHFLATMLCPRWPWLHLLVWQLGSRCRY